MKNRNSRMILVSKIQFIIIICVLMHNLSFAQVSYCPATPPNVPGTCASQLGFQSHARGAYSFASGYQAIAYGNFAVAIGQQCYSKTSGYSFGNIAKANADNTFAIGRNVQTDGINSIIIGASLNPAYPLINNYSNCITMGINVTEPTLTIKGPENVNSGFGKVGIGTSSPATNLHILSNTNENALLYVQNKQFSGTVYAGLLLGNLSHGITADPNNGLMFRTQKYYLFNDGDVGIGTSNPLSKLQVIGTSLFDKVGIGTSNPLADLQVNGSVSIGYEAAIPSQSKSLIVNGFLGVGTNAPEARVDVRGKLKAENLQLTSGFNTGYLMVSDYQGNASWADPTTVNAGAWIRNGNNIYVGSDKKIGIGIETPAEQLQIAGNMLLSGAIKGGHTDWHPLAIYGGTNETDGSYILMGNNSAGSDGSIKLFAKGTNSAIEFSNKNMIVLALRANNDIVMGNPDMKVKLQVNGDITANLVRVNTQSWWDCVFDADYNLQPLAEVEAYINQHKHLPEIPSEAEVKANGIDVAQMNALLLKKVEELTLYVIELEKRVNLMETK